MEIFEFLVKTLGVVELWELRQEVRINLTKKGWDHLCKNILIFLTFIFTRYVTYKYRDCWITFKSTGDFESCGKKFIEFIMNWNSFWRNILIFYKTFYRNQKQHSELLLNSLHLNPELTVVYFILKKIFANHFWLQRMDFFKAFSKVASKYESCSINHIHITHCVSYESSHNCRIVQGILYLDGRNSQKYLHQTQANF